MGQFSLTHLLLLAIIALIFFGPSRLPQLGKSMGKAIRGFKDGLSGQDDDDEKTAKSADSLNAPRKSEQDALNEKQKDRDRQS
jgi:sec-independent protein translocase protein TatA